MTAKRQMVSDHSKPLHFIDDSFKNTSKPVIEIIDLDDDETCCTFVLHHQDHTLGNSLRSIISRYEGVELCGYTNPHPLEPKIHLRIQTDARREDLTPKLVLENALRDLKEVTRVIQDKFEDAWNKFESQMK